MSWYTDNTDCTMNFAIIGDFRSGIGIVQEVLAQHEMIACHRDNFHPHSSARQKAHGDYFGYASESVIEWFEPDDISANSYLKQKIFNKPCNGERAVGIVIPYQVCETFELWEHLKEWDKEVCVIHVTRNPVACFVAAAQAEKYGEMPTVESGKGVLSRLGKQLFNMPSIYADADELVAHVRQHEMIRLKLSRSCPDRLVIPYHELLLDFATVRWNMLKFLGLPDTGACWLRHQGLKNRSMKRRISNLLALQSLLPADVLSHVNSPDLF